MGAIAFETKGMHSTLAQVVQTPQGVAGGSASPGYLLVLLARLRALRMAKGRRGAFMMGLRHGFLCVSCCWALMLLLFAGGAMNLLWVGTLALLVLIEKLGRQGGAVARAVGGPLDCLRRSGPALARSTVTAIRGELRLRTARTRLLPQPQVDLNKVRARIEADHLEGMIWGQLPTLAMGRHHR